MFHSISEIGLEAWEALAPADFPFASYHFLRALETTGCLGTRTGWEPQFIGAYQGDRLVGALIAYLKNNSYGEYIFDWAWAQAFENNGLPYYPKLTSAIPFTPATGPKILGDEAPLLLAAYDDLARALKVSSAHALFLRREEVAQWEAAGYFARHSYQFHWANAEYAAFADFLAALRSKRRKEIVRERAQVAASGVKIVHLTGGELTPALAELFYSFYLSTIDKRSSFDYLTGDFFREIFATMNERLLLVLALNADEQPVAGALNFIGSETLYGRYWGCLEEYKALHFEVCYYQGIDYAIEHGLKKFEAGAQGEHKFQRGFLPALTYSAHKIMHPVFDRAIQDHVAREKSQLRQLFGEYEEHNPFRGADA